MSRSAWMLGVMVALGLALGGGHAAPKAAPSACFEDWWRARLDALRQDRREVTALLPLRQVAGKALTATDPLDIDAALEEIRALPGVHPLVAGEIDWVLLDRAETRGDGAGAAALRRRLGIVERFLLHGPFTAGEAGRALFAGLAEGTGWREVGVNPQGFVPLSRLMTPRQKTSASAVCYLNVRRPVDVALRYGADDRATLWLDGQRLESPEGRHAAVPDQHAAIVRLTPGWHRVLLEVEQDEGFWGFTLRLTTPEGGPLGEEVGVEWPADRRDVERQLAAAPPPGRRPASRNDSLLLALGRVKGPRGRGLQALEMRRLQLPDRNSPEPAALIRQALAGEPADPDLLWIAGQVDSDPASRRQAFERLAGLFPAHPLALRELIDHHAAFDQWEAVGLRAQEALAACPGRDPFAEAWKGLAQDSPGFAGGALASLLRVRAAAPRQPLVLKTIAALAQRNGRPRLAREALTEHLSLAGGMTEQRADLVNLAASAGDEEEVERLIGGAIEFDPLALDWRQRKIRFLLSQGRPEEAEAEAARSLALSPGQPDLLVNLGEALLAQGDGAGAARAWEQARENSDQAVQLSERIAAVTGVDDTFGASWTVSLEQALAIEAERPVTGDPAVVVLSRTVAVRVGEDGLASQFQQQILRVRRPEQAGPARGLDFIYSPRLQRATVIEARLLRQDGTILVAERLDRPLVPDLQMRMWYDTRALTLAFPRLEEGDLIDVRTRITDRGPVNPIGQGYFGDILEFGGTAPVLSSRLVFDYDPDRPVNYKFLHLPAPPAETREIRDGRQVVVATLPPLPAYPAVDGAPPPVERLPFALAGTTPDWTSLGRLYGALTEPQLALDQDLKETVAALKKGARSSEGIVRAVYRWVIENTRYVALEFGIHALKPYPVAAVFHRRHGDCKDKAVLLVAMLKEAGVPAFPVLVRTHDQGEADTSIPTFAHFNHAIVFVPGENLWLDGTVLHHGSRELPQGDRDSLALLITPDKGGVLTRTPALTPEDAVLEREETITLLEDGTAAVKVSLAARGETAAMERSMLAPAERPVGVLAHRLEKEFPGWRLDEARFGDLGLEESPLRYSFSGRIERFSQASGAGVFVPMAMSPPRLPLAPPAPRSVALALPFPYRETTTALIRPLPGSQWRELPREGVVDSPWGRGSVTVDREAGGVRLRTEVVFRGGTVAPADLSRLAAFLEELRQLLQQRAVLEEAL